MLKPLAAVLLFVTAPASALTASRSIDVAASPAKVWRTIGGFCGIGDWHPAIASCAPSTRDGKPVRTLALKGGGTIVERQESRDDTGMRYTYSIIDGPLPVADYRSTLRVTPNGTGATVTWSGDFAAKGADDATATATIAGIYDAGIKAIAAAAK